ncbi:hypothetical protein PILCRDRAFT_7326 [Piloderma croceum F 1598]|uniref:Uncharacterized protein n=1 Tax=Piloderma croceum (strain F 1598) TaxID=765440 RepID=A0A0C3C1C5_PILCF|nr:hypothetical protein PILCRDRAFT_7326 [Piloderma croceum F 1598]
MLFHIFVLLSVLVAIGSLRVAASSESCEFYARKLGAPLDGWKPVSDTDGPSCIRESVDLACPGEQYYDPATRIPECCDPEGTLVWMNKDAKLGYCCAAMHEWTGDLSTGEGGCCPIGFRMVDGRCQSLPSVENEEVAGKSCGCHSKSEPSPDDDERVTVPTVVADLTIKYGRCYVLSFPDGREIGSNRENNVYTPSGLFQDRPFRVCRSTNDCSLGGNVHYKGQFYLEDQIGMHSDRGGKMGWVTTHEKGSKMKFTLESSEATEYEGVMKCAELGCPIRLSAVPQELHFNEVLCETDPSRYLSVQMGDSDL